MEKAVLAKELASAVIELQIDNKNRQFGVGSLSDEEVIDAYGTLFSHLKAVVGATGDRLRPEFQDVDAQLSKLGEIVMLIDLGNYYDEENFENNSRIANEFISSTLRAMFA